MDTIMQTLGGLEPWVLYALLGALVFGESAAVVAVLLPGEVALLAAGALVERGRLDLGPVIVIAFAAAVLGHAAGYELGRRYGLRVVRWPLLRRYAGAFDRAAVRVAHHGGAAVFLGRWTNVGRIVVPLLVGAGRMRYRRFALYNGVGALVWVLTFVALGTAAGASLHELHAGLGRAGWWLTVGGVGTAAAWWIWRRARSGRAPVAAYDDIEDGRLACRLTLATSSRSGQPA